MVKRNYRKNTGNTFGLKNPRAPVSAYAYALTAKNIVLFIIFAITIILAVVVISSFPLNPERRAKSDFEALATYYYENIFYADLLASDNFSGNPRVALEKYKITGLATVTLRQLSLSDRTDQNLANYLLKYCDEDRTFVTFYPESPYSKTSYRAEYTYSCNF